MTFAMAQSRPLEIVPQEPVVIQSSILAHFSSKPNTAPFLAKKAPTADPPTSEIQSGTVLKSVENILANSSATGEEPTVFKHKGVNTLIRNRIMALENSVASKTVEKKPLIEVDTTIKQVKETEITEVAVEMKPVPQPEVLKPTAKIREIAQSMHSMQPPVLVVDLPKLAPEESEEPKATTKVLLKDSAEPTKSALTKKYSYDMETKFHEETVDDGWKRVEDIPIIDTTDSEEETEVSTDIESEEDEETVTEESEEESIRSPTPPKSNLKKNKRDENPPRLEKKTVDRILQYDSYSECVDSSLFESFESYLRRRNLEAGYDPELYDSRSEYDSCIDEYYSDYTEYTNALENESFINGRYDGYDTESVRSFVTYDSKETDTDYYSDSVFIGDDQSEYVGRHVVDDRSDYDGRSVLDDRSDYDGRSVLDERSDYDGRSVLDDRSDYDGHSVLDDRSDYDGRSVLDDRSDYDGRSVLDDRSDYDSVADSRSGYGDRRGYYSEDGTSFYSEDDRTVTEGSVYSGYTTDRSEGYTEDDDRTPVASEYGDDNYTSYDEYSDYAPRA